MSGGVSSDDRNKNRQHTGHQSTEAGLGSSAGSEARVAAGHEELTKAGFSAEEIAKIAEKVPDLNVKILKPTVGDSIQSTSADAVQLLKEAGCPVVFKFNDSLLVVSHGDSSESVVNEYWQARSGRAANDARWTTFKAVPQVEESPHDKSNTNNPHVELARFACQLTFPSEVRYASASFTSSWRAFLNVIDPFEW